MSIYLTPHNDEYEEYEGEIAKCILKDGYINIVFQAEDDGEIVQGRISLKATEKEQKANGVWIYPEEKKEKARFTERQNESEEYRITSTIIGKLKKFKKNKVVFSGVWKDEDTDYDLEIETNFT